MAGSFDAAISYIEVPIASPGTTDISAITTITASQFTLPFDAEIVGASVTAITGTGSVPQVLEFNLCNGTTASPMWTAATTVSTVSTIRVDQGVVTVTCAAATNLSAGQEITFTTANADTTGKLSAALLTAINKNQVVTSVSADGKSFTFGPLPQAAFYDTATGFWKFTIAPVTPTTLGKLQLAEAPALTIGTTSNAYVADLAGRPDKTYKYGQNLQGVDLYPSAAIVPAGTVIIPTYQTKSVAALSGTAYNSAGNAPVNITLQVAVRKA